MPWFRVDDTFSDHPKVDELSLGAVGLWTLAGSWSARNLTDGHVTPARVRKFGGTNAEVTELVTAGLWIEDGDGWRFKGWDEYQPTKESVEDERAAARKRMRDYRAKKKNPGATSGDVTANNAERAPNEQRSNDVGSAAPTLPCPSHKKSAASDYSDEFEAWWKQYPSTANKAGAYKAYKAAAKKHDDLAGKLRAYLAARERQKRSGEFVPHAPNASTWLNQERWNDYGQVVTITRADGAQIPEWSKQECDEILGGPDYWSCPRPPEHLDIPGEVAWKREQVAAHLNERRQKAWEVIQRDSAA